MKISEVIAGVRKEWCQMTPEEQVMLWGRDANPQETLDQFCQRMAQLPKGATLLMLELLSEDQRSKAEEYLSGFEDDVNIRWRVL